MSETGKVSRCTPVPTLDSQHQTMEHAKKQLRVLGKIPLGDMSAAQLFSLIAHYERAVTNHRQASRDLESLLLAQGCIEKARSTRNSRLQDMRSHTAYRIKIYTAYHATSTAEADQRLADMEALIEPKGINSIQGDKVKPSSKRRQTNLEANKATVNPGLTTVADRASEPNLSGQDRPHSREQTRQGPSCKKTRALQQS